MSIGTALYAPQAQGVTTIQLQEASFPRLRTLLTSIDALRGPGHDEALLRALGVDSLKNDDAGTRTVVTQAGCVGRGYEGIFVSFHQSLT